MPETPRRGDPAFRLAPFRLASFRSALFCPANAGAVGEARASRRAGT